MVFTVPDTNLEKARKNVLRKSFESDLKLPIVKGHDFDKGTDFSELMKSFATTGFQATQLSKAIELIKKMRKENVTIFLGYTSNMVTSGLRDVFRYLAKHKLIDVIVTTTGGIEEDFCKCFGPFYVGEFEASGKELRKKGINRAGNIFIPNSRYGKFEDFVMPILKEAFDEQKKTGKIIAGNELIRKMGEKINNEDSIYYWCSKNKIPVFCPVMTDGSLGDMIYFFKARNPDFYLDISADIKEFTVFTLDAKKTGLIILGGGSVKHHICNANMMRNGADYAVYVNTGQEFDGSDSGAMPDEAVSWGKILPSDLLEKGQSKPTERTAKVFGDATILFPLIVAECFSKN